MNEQERKELLGVAMADAFEQLRKAEPGSKEQYNMTENAVKLYRMACDEYRIETEAYLNECKQNLDEEIQRRRVLADINRHNKVSADAVLKVGAAGILTAVTLVYNAKGHLVPTAMLKYVDKLRFLG